MEGMIQGGNGKWGQGGWASHSKDDERHKKEEGRHKDKANTYFCTLSTENW